MVEGNVRLLSRDVARKICHSFIKSNTVYTLDYFEMIFKSCVSQPCIDFDKNALQLDQIGYSDFRYAGVSHLCLKSVELVD